jgi:hypothetical protein
MVHLGLDQVVHQYYYTVNVTTNAQVFYNVYAQKSDLADYVGE